jgi:aromatic-amino-acid transaminase
MRANVEYNKDPRPEVKGPTFAPGQGKVGLVVGEYRNENGEVPTLECVKKAESLLAAIVQSKGYQPLTGHEQFRNGMQKLLFGQNSEALSAGQVTTVQAHGGTNALYIGARFLLKTLNLDSIAVTQPTWPNHQVIFEEAGFKNIHEVPYLDPESQKFNPDRLIAHLGTLAPRTAVVLHTCCHNPSGCDPTPGDWQAIAEAFSKRGEGQELIPFFDTAYQGFQNGLFDDSYPIRLFAERGIEFLAAQSGSKTFSAYNMRVGALHVFSRDPNSTDSISSAVANGIVRRIQSSPIAYGAQVAATILNDSSLYSLLEEELGLQRHRISANRDALDSELQSRGVNLGADWRSHSGMFSLIRLSESQDEKLRTSGLHMPLERTMTELTGLPHRRLCLPLIRQTNIDYVVDAFVRAFADA